jgi:hypothetical protein
MRIESGITYTDFIYTNNIGTVLIRVKNGGSFLVRYHIKGNTDYFINMMTFDVVRSEINPIVEVRKYLETIYRGNKKKYPNRMMIQEHSAVKFSEDKIYLKNLICD